MNAVPRLMVALLALLPVSLAAQERTHREGFGSSFGPSLVVGSIDYEYGCCGGTTFAGGGGYLRLGRYLKPDLFLGIEANLHTLTLDHTRWDTNFLTGVLVWYPRESSGFHLKGSLGVARFVEVDGEDFPAVKHSLTSPAIGIGLGIDIRTRHRFQLTPFAGATFQNSSFYKKNGSPTRIASGHIYQIGLGFTWY